MKKKVFGIFVIFVVTIAVGTSVIKIVGDERKTLVNVVQAEGEVSTLSRGMTENANETVVANETDSSKSEVTNQDSSEENKKKYEELSKFDDMVGLEENDNSANNSTVVDSSNETSSEAEVSENVDSSVEIDTQAHKSDFEIDAKDSKLNTKDGSANFVVEVTGDNLNDVDKIYFRTVADSNNNVLDTFKISDFSEQDDDLILFSLEDNSEELQPADYVGQTIHAQISEDGDDYFDVTSSKELNLEVKTDYYTSALTADKNEVVNYEVSSAYTPVFELQANGNVIAYDVRDHSKIGVEFIGSKVEAVEGLAWDEEEQKLYYAADMKEDGMFSNDSQDIYVLTDPTYEDGIITFNGKERLYDNLTVADPYNHDTNSLNEGAAYNKNMDSYDFTYRKSDGLFGGKPHDIKVSYAASGSGALEKSINFTSVIPGYNGNRAYDIAYDHIHDQYIIAMGGSGVITSNNGSVIYDGKANGLAVREDYLHILESDGNYEIYDLNTYKPVYTYAYNLTEIKDAA